MQDRVEKARMRARAAIESQYDGRCTVFGTGKTMNPVTKRMELGDIELFAEQPCHMSVKTVSKANDTDHVSVASQEVKLLIAPELEIPEGSKIVITQQGITRAYENSGIAGVYSTHQEIMLDTWRRA